MKKVIYVSIPFVLIALASFLYANYFSPRAQQEKQFNELIAQKNDSLIMSKYLSGYDFAGRVEPMADSIAYRKSMQTDFNPRILKLAFAVLEKTRGIDSTARLIYSKKRFDYKNCFSSYVTIIVIGGRDWNDDISVIESSLSPELLIALKILVTKESDDPVWLSRYISKQGMLDLCLSGCFGEKQLIVFSKNLSANDQQIVFEIFSDEVIIKYHLASKISEKRMFSIANKIELREGYEEAYNFLAESKATFDYRKSLIKRNINKLDGFDLLWYHAVNILKKEDVSSRIKVLTTKQLVEDFPKRTNVDIWEYSYDEFARAVINSIKRDSDGILAFKFIDYFSDEGSKSYWLRTLNAKTSNMTITML